MRRLRNPLQIRSDRGVGVLLTLSHTATLLVASLYGVTSPYVEANKRGAGEVWIQVSAWHQRIAHHLASGSPPVRLFTNLAGDLNDCFHWLTLSQPPCTDGRVTHPQLCHLMSTCNLVHVPQPHQFNQWQFTFKDQTVTTERRLLGDSGCERVLDWFLVDNDSAARVMQWAAWRPPRGLLSDHRPVSLCVNLTGLCDPLPVSDPENDRAVSGRFKPAPSYALEHLVKLCGETRDTAKLMQHKQEALDVLPSRIRKYKQETRSRLEMRLDLDALVGGVIRHRDGSTLDTQQTVDILNQVMVGSADDTVFKRGKRTREEQRPPQDMREVRDKPSTAISCTLQRLLDVRERAVCPIWVASKVAQVSALEAGAPVFPDEQPGSTPVWERWYNEVNKNIEKKRREYKNQLHEEKSSSIRCALY